MKKIQAGFTMIELIIVIVILGILAAVAIPQYIDMRADAARAAVAGVAGSISSAMAVNYAGRTVAVANGVAVANCSAGATVLQGGALPTAGGVYAITAAAVGVGLSVSCVLTFTPTAGGGAQTANFIAIGIA